MIIVTGATGQLGSQIVQNLLERVPADTVGVSVQDPEKAASLAGQGVRVRRGDFTDPRSLEASFEGADQVLVVSAAIRGSDAVKANIAAIDAAHAAGAKRIVYTSHQAAAASSLFSPAITHAATEAHLQQLGVPFTALRNGFYATTLGYYIAGAIETGRFTVPENGPVSWTTHADLAEAAASALTADSVLDGITAPLTAPDTLTFTNVAGILGEISGRSVECVVVSDEQWKADAVERGMPAPAADFSLGMFRAARAGEFASTGPLLESVIGHRPRNARSVLAAHLSAQ